MIYKPKLNEYDIPRLIALANLTTDEFSRNDLKKEIVKKVLLHNYPMFFLIDKFIHSKTIMKEVYADVILINMKGNDYDINDVVVNEILIYASLDSLMYYGADSASYEFNKKCKDEFYRRGREFEDKIELQRKIMLGKKLIRKLYVKKGD